MVALITQTKVSRDPLELGCRKNFLFNMEMYFHMGKQKSEEVKKSMEMTLPHEAFIFRAK